MARSVIRVGSTLNWLVLIPVHLPLTERSRRPRHLLPWCSRPHLVKQCLVSQLPKSPARPPAMHAQATHEPLCLALTIALAVRIPHVSEEVFHTTNDRPNLPRYYLRYGPMEIRGTRGKTRQTRDPTRERALKRLDLLLPIGKYTSMSVAVPAANLYTYYMYNKPAQYQGRRILPTFAQIPTTPNSGLRLKMNLSLEVR